MRAISLFLFIGAALAILAIPNSLWNLPATSAEFRVWLGEPEKVLITTLRLLIMAMLLYLLLLLVWSSIFGISDPHRTSIPRWSIVVITGGIGLGAAAHAITSDPTVRHDPIVLRSSEEPIEMTAIEMQPTEPPEREHHSEPTLGGASSIDPPDDVLAETADTWTVRAGDHLWAIATETITDFTGESPEEEHVARYWFRLISVNRDRLIDPDNPDLIVEGQVLVLPDPSTQ